MKDFYSDFIHAFTPDYIKQCPWKAALLIVVVSIALLLPAQYMEEMLGMELPKEYEDAFELLFQSPWAFVQVCLLVPILEEFLFRGLILRALLHCVKRLPWVAIALSALAFAVAHGNMAQGIHAFLIGLFLGWAFWRTHSIVMGVLFHCTNNLIAYLLLKHFPDMESATLVEVFGSHAYTLLAVGLSSAVAVVAIYVLNKVLPHPTAHLPKTTL